MLLIRDVFRCRPGRARALAESFQRVMPLLQSQGALSKSRILIDYVSDYWTVVWEAEVENLAEFEHHMEVWGSSQEVREAMQGYLDNVKQGHREVFRIYTPA